jgi:methyltransferase-like protein/predicted O-methyltransferase YrrM
MTNNYYDELPYHSVLGYDYQPNAIASLSLLHGIEPPALNQARILELGCGDGTNLLAAAQSLPQAKFWGIDISSSQLAQAQAVIDATGLDNVILQNLDLMVIDADFGKFDYIMVHGLFSWVPHEVQKQILDICRQNLSENGLACISYNVLPGWNMLKTVFDMLRYHQQRIDNNTISHRIAEARGILKLAAELGTEQQSFYGNFLQERHQTISNQTDDYLFHEYLEGMNNPMYFHEFMGLANKYELHYVAEVDFRNMHMNSHKHQQVFTQLDKQDRITREQYYDFFLNRSYRSSILCHNARVAKANMQWQQLSKLYIAINMLPQDQSSALRVEPNPKVFKTFDGKEITIEHTLTQTAINYLASIYPQPSLFNDIFAQVLIRLGINNNDPAKLEVYRQVLAEELLSLYAKYFNLVELSLIPPAFTTTISEKPIVSPLARWQAQHGQTVANLQCKIGNLDNLMGYILIHLDGQHTATDLVNLLLTQIEQGNLKLELDHNDTEQDQAQVIRQGLENLVTEILTLVARSALLIA